MRRLCLRAICCAAFLAGAFLSGCVNYGEDGDNEEKLNNRDLEWLPYDRGEEMRFVLRDEATGRAESFQWAARDQMDYTEGGFKSDDDPYEVVEQLLTGDNSRSNVDGSETFDYIQLTIRLEARREPKDRVIWVVEYGKRDSPEHSVYEFWQDEVYPRSTEAAESNIQLRLEGATYQDVYRIPVKSYRNSPDESRLNMIYYHKEHGFLRLSFDHGDYDLSHE